MVKPLKNMVYPWSWCRGGSLPTELRGRTEKVGDDLGGESQRRESRSNPEVVGSIPNEVKIIFSLPRVVP